MKKIKTVALCLAILALANSLCACTKNVDEGEKTNSPETEIVQNENLGENEAEQNEVKFDPNEFFNGTEPTEAVKMARKERISALKQELTAKGYSVSEISEYEIIVTSPDGETTQYGGSTIDVGKDGIKLLPNPNFTYYVSEARDYDGEMELILEDISPKAISSYAVKVQHEGFDREVMSSTSADKQELYFHAEDKDGRAIDITARIDHRVMLTFVY